MMTSPKSACPDYHQLASRIHAACRGNRWRCERTAAAGGRRG